MKATIAIFLYAMRGPLSVLIACLQVHDTLGSSSVLVRGIVAQYFVVTRRHSQPSWPR